MASNEISSKSITALSDIAAFITNNNMSGVAINVSSSNPVASMSVEMYKNTFLNEHPWLLILFVISLSFASVCGVVGNFMVIYAVAKDRFLRQPASLLITNVAISDFFVAAILNPFNIAGAVYGYELFAHRRWLCLLIGSLCVPVCTSCACNLALIAVSRYVRICKFNCYAKIYTWNKTFLMCLSVWIFGFLLHVPNHIGWGRDDYIALFFICSTDPGVYSYAVSRVTVGMLVPFVIIIASYGKIYLKLRRRDRRSQSEATRMNPTSLFVSTTRTSNEIGQVVQSPQQRRIQNFVVRDATISDNNLDTVNAGPYCKRSFPATTDDYHGPYRGTQTAAALAAAKKKKSRAIIKHYNKHVRTFRSAQEEIELIRTLFITVVAFVAGWWLFIFVVLLGTPDWIPKWVYVLSIFLVHLQSAVNPIIYCSTNVHFRNVYRAKKVSPSN